MADSINKIAEARNKLGAYDEATSLYESALEISRAHVDDTCSHDAQVTAFHVQATQSSSQGPTTTKSRAAIVARSVEMDAYHGIGYVHLNRGRLDDSEAS